LEAREGLRPLDTPADGTLGPTNSRVDSGSVRWLDWIKSAMPASRNRLSRFLTDSRPPAEPAIYSVSSFYREEFLKRQRCLEQQREFYSERAINDVEQALLKVIGQLDRLCTKDNADELVGRLLRQFDVATGLSAWTDPRHVN
jgi:hypothetical protein